MDRVGPLCATAFVRMQVEIRETRSSVVVYGPGLYGNTSTKKEASTRGRQRQPVDIRGCFSLFLRVLSSFLSV